MELASILKEELCSVVLAVCVTVGCLAMLRIATLRYANYAWLLLVRTGICAYFGVVFPILEAVRSKAWVYG